jgi:hypothetical protein
VRWGKKGFNELNNVAAVRAIGDRFVKFGNLLKTSDLRFPPRTHWLEEGTTKSIVQLLYIGENGKTFTFTMAIDREANDEDVPGG